MNFELNRQNYEQYLVDYLDGNLSALEVAELLLFLEQNPDIREEFESMTSQKESIYSSATFGNKQSLKKFNSSSLVTEDNYADFILKRIEKELGELENTELDKFIGFYPPAKKDLALFEKTVLQPDMNIQFAGKKALKRSARVIPLFYQYAAAAAVLILLVALPFLLTSPGQHIARAVVPPAFAPSLPGFKQAAVVSPVLVAQEHISTKSVASAPLKDKTQTPVNDKQEPVLFADNKKAEQLPAVKEKELQKEEEEIAPVAVPADIKTAEPVDFPSLKELALAKLKHSSSDHIIEENAPEKTSHKKFSAWDLAALTAKAVNKVTGNDIKLKKQYDAEGKVVEYGLVASNFEFSQSR